MKPDTYLCEAEVTPGLESVSEAEIRALSAHILRSEAGEIDFRFTGDLRTLLRLRTVQAVSLVQAFPVPRPRALLSNEYLPRIRQQIEFVRSLSPKNAYQSYYLSAAGSETAVMQRIKSLIEELTGLQSSEEKGDLWVRIRPGRVGLAGNGQGGWEVVVRLTPRPLVTRSWRVCNLEGALNAATAHAMIMLTNPKADDVFANLGCGSGTLLIERLAHSACQNTVGIDLDSASLDCARANARASGFGARIRLTRGDLRALPLPSDSVSALCADLPFGQLSGTHAQNERLYPRALSEAARVAHSGARFVLITHEVKLIDTVLRQQDAWEPQQTFRVNLRGLHPRIYVLRRR